MKIVNIYPSPFNVKEASWFTFEENFGRFEDGMPRKEVFAMLKIEEDVCGAYRVGSAISPVNYTLVSLKDRQYGKTFFCVGSSTRPHPPSNLFEEYGLIGSFGLPATHVIRCSACSLMYHVPGEKVEVVPFYYFF